jgi:hypothetical protein
MWRRTCRTALTMNAAILARFGRWLDFAIALGVGLWCL